MVIVLLLVLVWAVALTPIVWRKLSDAQAVSEIARFRVRIRTLGRAAPAGGVAWGGYLGTPVPVDRPATRPMTEAQRRMARTRNERLIARRRRTLSRLAGTAVGTLVLGAIPALRVLWDLSLVTTLLTIAYLAALAWFQREHPFAAERPANVVPIRSPARPERWTPTHDTDERAVVAGGGGRASFGFRPPSDVARRPAFVLVDAPP